MASPTLRRITTFPLKSLDPLDRQSARVVETGALDGDREFALFDASGAYVNGKATAAVHSLRTEFDPDTRRATVAPPDREAVTASVDDPEGRERLTASLESHFGDPVSLRRNAAGGFPDDQTASGPTVISTATLREVASWYPGVDVDGVRRRFRANLEIGSVPAFWEDRLFSDRDHVVAFDVGDVRFRGVTPCQRCVVPSRDPDTGDPTAGFRETFVRRRRETMPEWSGGERFDHDYRLMVNTVVSSAEWGKTLRVGDRVEIRGERPVEP